MIPHVSMHDRLAAKPGLFGMLQHYPNPLLCEMAGKAGYDFMLVDCEHGLFSDLDVWAAVLAGRAADLAILVRPRSQDGQAIGRYMDMGVDGLLVPGVETAEQAAKLVTAMDYAPLGTRGYSPRGHRISGYGYALAEHKATPRGDIFICALIETEQGVANLDAIMAVDGMDAALIGPSDFTAQLGCAEDLTLPALKEAYVALEQAGRAQGKTIGSVSLRGQSFEDMRALGYRLFILGSEVQLISDAMSAQLAKNRPSPATP